MQQRTFPQRLAAAVGTPGGPAFSPLRQRRWLILLGVVVVFLAAVLGYLNASPDPEPNGRTVLPKIPMFSAEPAVSVRPSPPPTFSPPPVEQVSTNRPLTPESSAATTRKPNKPPASRPRTASPSPTFGLAMNSTVSLEPVNRPGLRVRHRDYRARVDVISSRLDRADSAFIVRNGLSNKSCVSFESTNYPGYFLRHADFRIYIAAWDSSRSYPQDATFCAKPSGDGSASILESVNYPGRFLSIQQDQLYLSRTATAFKVGPPL